MSWPPSYLTMDQSTKIHGNIIFGTGSIITSTGQDLMGHLKEDYLKPVIKEDKQLSTEDNKIITTEDAKEILMK